MRRTRGTPADPALHIGLDADGAVTVVTPVGVLAVPTAPHLHHAVLACLAEQADAVVVDLSLLYVKAPHLLHVFPAAVHRTAPWTGTELVLVSGPPAAEQGARLVGVSRLLRVYPTMRTALAALDRSPPRRLARMPVGTSPAAVTEGREFIRNTCATWHCDDATDDAETIGAELVGNAVRHTAGPATLRLELRRELLTVSVGDHSAAPAVLRPPNGDGGSGLQIVKACADHWSSTPALGGKTVWATVHTGCG